jgi:predicted  nucleic acid-binding Zn-ribbon protein
MEIWSHYGLLSVFLLLVLLLLWRSGFFARLFRIVEEMIFSNWQLALLGATAVALSLASGYTTFDGLRNFTNAPLLSVLIAFGIQGVMLIVAWLIGESFATGMNQRLPRGKGPGGREALIGMGLGVALVGLVFYWVLSRYDAVGFSRGAGVVEGFRADWTRFADVALYFSLALLVVAILAFNFRRGGDISTPYVQSVRIVLRSVILWVMFLASMAASVFFSFDSHFNAIFPADAKTRAAEIRTLNQVGRVVADIGEEAQRARLVEAERLFDAPGWKAYDAQLATLAQEAKAAQGDIEKYLIGKMEERQRKLAEQQERIAGSERSQSALLRRRDEAEAELHRLERAIGVLEADLAKAQATYSETRQAIASKRIDASAEDGGVEGTLKRGKGPVYRQRVAELEELQRKLAITDEPRFREAQRERDRASARIVGLKREIATVNGEIAKYKGETRAAESRIKAVEALEAHTEGKVDPARALPAFERARAAFRQQPDADRLGIVQAQCNGLLGAMLGTPAAKERVRSVDCDPKEAADAAARLFALDAGFALFKAKCAGGAKLPQNATTDRLLGFGRQCLQDSGLTGREAEAVGARLQAIDMNRDDKAHRFVVTWNAFLDGNRLAYLALVLAIGVDALVFMAGLFGAAAVKSPLSDVPSPKARSAGQLEAIVRNALGEDRVENAELVLAAMKPSRGDDDHRAEVDLTHCDPEMAGRIRKVMVAGRSIGAVERASTDKHDEERYLVRSELFEYLSMVANSARDSERKRSLEGSELVRIVGAALEPQRRQNAENVLKHLHPIDKWGSFIASIDLNAVPEDQLQMVQTVLNAGMAHNAVKHFDRWAKGRVGLLAQAIGRPRRPGMIFLVSDELFKALLQHRASPFSPTPDSRSIPLTSSTAAITESAGRSQRLLTSDRNGRAGNGSARESDQDMRRRFRERLLEALGLPNEALEEQEVAYEAMTAATELKRQAATNRSLGVVLDRIERETRQKLDEAAGALGREHPGDRRAGQVLGETRREIVGIVLALMLLPQGKLFDDMIAEAERRGDDGLRERLEALRGEIEDIDPASGSDWRRIARRIRELTGGSTLPTH